jgi:multiple sugar transport system substrate-binding protein
MQRKSPRARTLFFLSLPGLGATAFFFLTLLGLGGCTGTSQPTVPAPPKFGRVRVACPPELGQNVVKTYGRHWEARTEGTIDLVPVAADQADPPEADVWLVPSETLPRWAAAGQLRPLPETLVSQDDYQWKSLLSLYGEKLVVWDRKRYAVPILGQSFLCCYRGDWLGNPREQAAFEKQYKRKLGPPATWDEFTDIAEHFFHSRKEPSLPPLPADGEALERIFYTIAANYASRVIPVDVKFDDDRALFSFQYDIESGEPRIQSGGFLHALRLLKRLQPCRAAEATDKPAVFYLLQTRELAALQEKAKGKASFVVCPMPGADGYYDFADPTKFVDRPGNRIPYLGGGDWLGVVPQSAKAEDAAFSLLTFLSSPPVSKQIVIDPQFGGGPTRQDHITDATRWESFGLGSEQTTVKTVLKEMLEHPGLKNPAGQLRTPDEAAHRLALQEELRAALQGTKTPEQALQDAAARWSKIDQQKGIEAHLKEYRISLGLLPK